MLNRFRIGTKLIGGFVVVLLLLVIVWQVGRWAVNQKTEKSKQIANAEALISAGLAMQRDIYDAIIAVSKETITRDEHWAKEVQRIVKKVQDERGQDFRLIETANMDSAKKKTMSDKYRLCLDQANEIAKFDAQAWNTEIPRKVAAADQSKFAEDLLTEIEKLSAAITQASKDGAIPHQPEGAQKEEPYYRGAFVERVQIVASIDNRVNRIRRRCFQYLATADAKEKTEHRGHIEGLFGEVTNFLNELDQQLTLDETRKILTEMKETVDKWHKALNDNMDLDDKYNGFDTDIERVSKILFTEIGQIVHEFETMVATELTSDAAFSTMVQRVLMMVSSAAILLGGIISVVLSRDIGGGIRAAVAGTKHVAETGDLTFEVPPQFLARKDEVGDLASSVTQMVAAFREVGNLAKDLADGNWRSDVKVRGDLDTMNRDLSAMIGQVNNTLHEIDESVKQVATGSGEVSNASQSLSSGAQESAASLEEITASMSEISSQTKTNAESAGQARDLAHQASQAAGEGQTAMKGMTEAMERITANSTEIQRVIKVIDDIAFQTNLLALNAAVEAARAGQHGKGFAVVAEEVRNLAARSAKAARETSELISKSSHEIDKGGEVANHTADVLNTIVEQVKQTTDLVAGIAAASNEQAQGVNQVTVGLQQIDSVTQQNTASAEESASAANEMSSMATNLQRLVAQFQLR